MSYPRPGCFFSPHAPKQLPRLRKLRETISNLSGGEQSTVSSEGHATGDFRSQASSPAQSNLPGATDSSCSAQKQSVTLTDACVHKAIALPGNSFFQSTKR
jgi:hypothetical protein